MSNSDPENKIQVEVVYPLPDEQKVLQVKVEKGTFAKDAVRQSGLLKLYPEINLDEASIGIYSRLLKSDEIVCDGDRIEIYRPLLADPKEVRKRRAEEAKAAKAAKLAAKKSTS